MSTEVATLLTVDPMVHESCTMGDLLARAIARGGSRVAFVCNGESVTYESFGQQLSQVSQALAVAGVCRGSGVACLAGNTVDAYLVTAACHLLGARVTNLHPMASAEDHVFIVEDCEAGVLVFDPAHYGTRALYIAQHCCIAPQLLSLGPCDSAADLVAASRDQMPAPLVPQAQAADPCLLVYTGGTTGKPKGVVHTHRSFVAVMMAELAEWEWPAQPVFLAITPISHGAGPCIVPVLLRGGTVVLESGFTPAKFLEIVRRHAVNATFLVPTMIYKILDHLEGSLASTPLQLVIYGAAPMSAARMQEALLAFGPVFMQLYGQSEAPNCVTVLRRVDHDPARFAHRLASCGQPIASNQFALLDPEGMPVASGQTGEICVRGPLVMAGYWKNETETAKALHGGWLRTGDLARMDGDGYVYIVGRSKDMIITGGFNVYPAEIEEVLCAHPAVSAAAVIGLPDRTWGEAVIALVTLRPGQQSSTEDLIARVRAAKGPICAPKRVEFLDTIPVTSLGKPDKKALREMFARSDSQATA
jgi:fatty-acyl-CoA synthase